MRSNIILRAAAGESMLPFPDLLETVRKWRDRFAAQAKVRALEDMPRQGRPADIPAAIRFELIKLACKRPSGEAAPFRKIWTGASLAQTLELETNHYLSETEIHPHRIRMWLQSPDPQFREKVETICSLYIHPPKVTKVFCIDEKIGMQTLEQRFPLRVACKKRSGRLEFEYIRHGTQTLIAALGPASGKVFAKCLASRKEKHLLSFMEALARRYPRGDIHIIWDNLNIHHGWRWVEFNRRLQNRFHFVWTPIHALWVNQIESWFSILKGRVLKHGDFHSADQLASEVAGFMKHLNRHKAHPFLWKFRGRWNKAG